MSVKVNEEQLREMRPDLNSTAAIRIWAQQLIDRCIQQMEMEDEETISIEEARAIVHAAIRDEYAKL